MIASLTICSALLPGVTGNLNVNIIVNIIMYAYSVTIPDEFSSQQIMEEAGVRGICRSSIYRMLQKAQSYELVTSVRKSYYRKTEKGKNVKNSKTA